MGCFPPSEGLSSSRKNVVTLARITRRRRSRGRPRLARIFVPLPTSTGGHTQGASSSCSSRITPTAKEQKPKHFIGAYTRYYNQKKQFHGQIVKINMCCETSIARSSDEQMTKSISYYSEIMKITYISQKFLYMCKLCAFFH